MKVCRIILAYPPYSVGGIDIYTEKIQNALTRAGHQGVIITVNPFKGDTVEEINGVKIYRFHPLNVSTIHNVGKESIIKQAIWTAVDMYSIYFYFKIRKVLRLEKPDIVHIHTPVDLTLSSVSAAKSLGFPIVYTLHDYFLLCRRFVLLHGFKTLCTDKNVNPLCHGYRWFTRRIVNQVDTVIGPSKFVLDMHTQKGFFENSRQVVLAHGIDLDQNKQAEKIEKRENKFNILYAGGLIQSKGIHLLIEAVKEIDNPDIVVHIVGTGVYEKELKRLATGDKRIVFHGRLENKDLLDCYQIADVTVVPSIWYDVRPNVIVESFKAQVPVIGSCMGGIPELVQEEYNGFLFDPMQAGDLKRVILKAMSMPDKLTKMGKNAVAFIQQFEMSAYIDKLVSVYQETIETKKNKR